MCKTQISKKLMSFLMSIVMILTSMPLLGVASFFTEIKAYAATGSGQTSISNGGNYGLNWEYIYGVGWSKIPTYNRALAGGNAYNSSDVTNMLKKYLVNGKGGSQKAPAPSDIPVYRLSRSNGYTNPDSSLISVNTIKIEDWKTLQSNAKADNIMLSDKQAQMINAVMYFGLKQFDNDGCAKQLEFLATQSLIWEISEGKRTGWGNETAYVSTGSYDSGNKDYASSSNSKTRSDAMTKAYSGDKKSRYYWHDYYYTQYYNKFKKSDGTYYTDYYQKILTACSTYNANLTFTSSNTVSGSKIWNTNKSSASTGEASWNGSAYTFTMTLPSGTVGTAIGQYDVKNLSLPSGVTVSASGNKITFTIKNIKSATYGITWYQTVPTGYNSAYYYKTKSSSTNGIRGYVNCGSIKKTNIYFNLKTIAYTVTYKCAYADCGYSSQIIKTEMVAKNGYPQNVPTQHTHTQQTFKGWYKGSDIVGKNGTANEIKAIKITANTTFNAKYEGWHSVTYICGYCGEEIKSETKAQNANVSTPSSTNCKNHMQEHQEEGIRVESTDVWYTNKNLTTKANISCGSNVTITNKDQTFYLGYQKLATVKFVCAFEEVTGEDENGNQQYDYCENKNIATYKDKIVGTTVSVPNAHISGENINHYTRGYEFAYWAIKTESGQFEKAKDIKSDNVKVTKDITYYAVYNKVGDPCDVIIKYININELDYGYNGNLDAVTPLKTISVADVLNKTNLLTGDVIDLSEKSYFTNVYTTTNSNGNVLDFTYTGNYLIANNEADLSNIDVSDLSVDETKDFTCNNEFVVTEDTTVYIFYDTDSAGLVNVYVFSSRSIYSSKTGETDNGLFAYPTNDEKNPLTINYTYNTLEKTELGEETGETTASVEKTGEYQTSNNVYTLSDIENAPNGYPFDTLYSRYVKLTFSPDSEELSKMNGLIPYTFSVKDENGIFDYTPGTVVGNYVGKGCETNVFFLAEVQTPKLTFKVIDSNNKPIENIDLNVCSNDSVLEEIGGATVANDFNSAMSNLADLLGSEYKYNEITLEDVFAKNVTGDDDLTTFNTELITDENGLTSPIDLNYLYVNAKISGVNRYLYALTTAFYIEDSNDILKNIPNAGFDVDLYCSYFTEDNYERRGKYKEYTYTPYIDPVLNGETADISNKTIPIALADNSSILLGVDSSYQYLAALGNIQVVIKLKEQKPVTVNVYSPEQLGEMQQISFKTSLNNDYSNTSTKDFSFENTAITESSFTGDLNSYFYYYPGEYVSVNSENNTTAYELRSAKKSNYPYVYSFDIYPKGMGETALEILDDYQIANNTADSSGNKYQIYYDGEISFDYNPAEAKTINFILDKKKGYSPTNTAYVIIDVIDNSNLDNGHSYRESNESSAANISCPINLPSTGTSLATVKRLTKDYSSSEKRKIIKNGNTTRYYYSYAGIPDGVGLDINKSLDFSKWIYNVDSNSPYALEGFSLATNSTWDNYDVSVYSIGSTTINTKNLLNPTVVGKSKYFTTSELNYALNNLNDNQKIQTDIIETVTKNTYSKSIQNPTAQLLGNNHKVQFYNNEATVKDNSSKTTTYSTALYMCVVLNPPTFSFNIDIADMAKKDLLSNVDLDTYRNKSYSDEYKDVFVKNAQVEVYDSNGELVNANGVTNTIYENGVYGVQVKDALPGTYTIKIKPPSGYEIPDGVSAEHTIILDENGIIRRNDLNEDENYRFSATTFLLESKLDPDENEDLDIQFITPANTEGYTYGTEVVSTFMVTNKSADFAYADKAIENTSNPKIVDPLSTVFTATVNYTVNGEVGAYELFKQDDKSLVLPAKESKESADRTNLLYYRWHVPTEDEIKDKIVESDSNINKDEIVINDLNCYAFVKGNKISIDNEKQLGMVKLINQDDSTVVSDGYNLNGGKTFVYQEPTNDKSYFNVATWEEWICVDGEFSKISNKATLGYSSNLLFPDGNNPTNGVKNQSWTTRSGYALSTNVITTSTVESTIPSIVNGSCTPAQTGEVYYPEYNYTREDKQFEPLVFDKTTNTFEFKSITNAGSTGKKHLTPVWFPNGDYITQTLVSGMWTPVGELNYLGKSNTVIIEGSLFDDYNTNEKSR